MKIADWGRVPAQKIENNGRVAPIAEKPIYRPHTVGRCMADVEATEVRWLWPGKIPRGRLTVLAGDGGLGKSFLSLAIAATLSRGAKWPDGTGGDSEPGATVLLSAEDDPNDTIRPRLDAAEADARFIHIVEGVQRDEKSEPGYLNLIDDLRALERKISDEKAVLCVIDPIGAYLAGTDSHKDSAVRGVLGPLAGLASRTDCAVLAILHLNKGATARVSHRVSGSVAFTNAARMAWLVAADPNDDKRRLLLPYKSNIVEQAVGIGFEICDGAVLWSTEPVTVDADSVLATEPGDKAERSEAESWLTELLAVGALPVTEIKRAAEADCHGWRSVERAKKSLGITSRREGFGKQGRFVWELSTVAAYESIDRQPKSGGQWDNSPETGIFPIDRQ